MKKLKLKRRIERKKMDKKRVIVFMIVFLFIISIGSFGFLKFQQYKEHKKNQTLAADIKKYYSNHVIVKKGTVLYDKNQEKVGKIESQNDFEIIKSKKDTFEYYQIKDTDYYLYYQDVVKSEKKENDESYTNYLSLNKNIMTKKKVNLYLENQLSLVLEKSLNVPIKFIDNENYYIDYLGKVYSVKKEDIKEVVDHENDTQEEASYISIINYNKLAKECSSEDCVSIKIVEEQLNYLKENGYYSITLEEYKNWLNGNIRLKPHAIFLMVPAGTDEVNSVNEKYHNILNIVSSNEEIKFIDDNNKTTKESKLNQLSRYNIKLDTNLDQFLKMISGEHVEIVQKVNKQEDSNKGPRIPVLNYHFFYDEGAKEICNENICLDVNVFRQQLDYLKNNNYKTLTIEEYRAWLYHEIELPEKSVLITIDDGALGTGKHNGNKLIPILEEYQMHATLFLITGWWDINNYRSSYLDIQSHTFDMHNTGSCGKAQMICASYDELVNDLQKSINVIGSKTAFCFPFYTFDEEAISAVRDVGFQMAFVGGNRKSSRSDNKYKIPRYPIHKTTTMENFINMVN